MLPEKYKVMQLNKILDEIKRLKNEIGDKVLVLGHHYQRDDVIKFADITGDSLKLSIEAGKSQKPYIIFCGVKFMAETADIITDDSKTVILPDLEAGCPMADMVTVPELKKAWDVITEIIDKIEIIPVTYVNSSAETKAFCGKNNGSTCTSSNAESVIRNILKQNKKILFLPDKNLGINTAKKINISEEEISVWMREKDKGGLSDEDVLQSKIIVWNGYCPVHVRFGTEYIKKLKKNDPEINIIVHPEVPVEVSALADYMGSTEYIIKTIKQAKEGSKWAVGTEAHLVSRLAKEYPEKDIKLLMNSMCICSTMYRISPAHLLMILENLKNGKVINKINVNQKTASYAKKAIDKMFLLTE
jgi:quinolinate synthase